MTVAALKVATIVGARPQFVKAGPVSQALAAAGHQEVLIHTGQHYDANMSQVFFAELGLPAPAVNLEVGSGSQGWQTGLMLMRLEEVFQAEQPDWVLVYGDTNSTLAGSLAACKLRLPLAHVEAGLRSYNRDMPEEHNRVLSDHCADLLLCPTPAAVANLRREGVEQGVHLVGDPMYDAVLHFATLARQRSTLVRDLQLSRRGYALATIHRPYNTDDPEQLQRLLNALSALDLPVVFPVHPRTRARLADLPSIDDNVLVLDPVGYLDMLALEQDAAIILTDSGGMQKEALWFGVPCVTLRPETEWVETVASGWNRLAWPDEVAILDAVHRPWPVEPPPPLFGDPGASTRIVHLLSSR